jgi:glutamyl-Q tRNA(Asp) synthetase
VLSSTSHYRGRFAPSPSGALHFGSLVAALGSWLCARSQRGAWLLRIEDIDPPRERPGAAKEILGTLQAFGMESDELVLYQSHRHALYRTALQRLIDSGDAFPCACTRSDLAPSGIHQGACKRSAAQIAWRLRVPDQVWEYRDGVAGVFTQHSNAIGDFVLWRADGLPAYQLAVVVDDQAQGISEVVRGNDLLDSTPRQIYLQKRLGFYTPTYFHLPLVLDAQGHKLSKSLASLPVNHDAPIPALQRALGVLGQPQHPGVNRVDQLLDAAVTHFDAALIPLTATVAQPSDTPPSSGTR